MLHGEASLRTLCFTPCTCFSMHCGVLHAQLESAALLQQRQQHEAAQAALHAEVASLREQLRSSTERAAKVRQKLEK